LEITRDKDGVFIKNGKGKNKTIKPGELYRLMIKTQKIEVIIAELDPRTVWKII